MQIDLTDKDFRNFSTLIYEKCGINLHQGKRELLKARLAKVLRRYKFNSIREYYDFLVKDPSTEKLIPLLDSISTNLTFFFREPKHFDFLSNIAIPELSNLQRNHSKKRINIWCAACSSGEEAYSIAITVMEALSRTAIWDVNIFATDISTQMLSIGEKGVYGKEKIEKIPYQWKRRYFKKGVNRWEGFFRVKPEIRRQIKFERLNLIEPPSFNQAFQVIFLRNVMIYFDKPTQEKLVNRFYEALNKGGYFFIGHSESLTGVRHKFKYIQPSVYVK